PMQTPGFGMQTAPWPMQTPGFGMQTAPWPMQTPGFGMQTAPWPMAAVGGHAVSPVIAMLLAQYALRDAVSRIGHAALTQRVTNEINEALDRTIDSFSGMGPHPWFGP